MPKPKTAAETLVELGVALAKDAASAPIPVTCKRCRQNHDRQTSTSQYPTIFCSKSCEREFIRHELASLTLEDCIRLQAKLEKLLRLIQDPLPFQKKQTG